MNAPAIVMAAGEGARMLSNTPKPLHNVCGAPMIEHVLRALDELCPERIVVTGKNAARIVRRDHANHKSPNCAWSEAAAAGALHIQLGGTHDYFGKPVYKPTIGDNDRPADSADIGKTVRLLFGSAGLMLFLLAVLTLIFR